MPWEICRHESMLGDGHRSLCLRRLAVIEHGIDAEEFQQFLHHVELHRGGTCMIDHTAKHQPVRFTCNPCQKERWDLASLHRLSPSK